MAAVMVMNSTEMEGSMAMAMATAMEGSPTTATKTLIDS